MLQQIELDIQQKQNFSMSQEMIMSLKILQMNAQELEQLIYEQTCENPFLEIDESFGYVNTNEYGLEIIDYINFEQEGNREIFKNNNCSLRDFLSEQLGYYKLDNKRKKIGQYIIDEINEDGYLEIDFEMALNVLNCKEEALNEMINLIQTFEPSGVGARDLKECLIIQIKNKNLLNGITEKLINNHLQDLADGNLSKIARSLNIDKSAVYDYLKIIKSLNPKPGLQVNDFLPEVILPEVIVEVIDEKIEVKMIDEKLPKIKINNYYAELLKNKNTFECEFLEERIKSAKNLIKNIEDRKKTILSISKALAEYQIEYLKGKGPLNPLTLSQLSKLTGYSISTVSRTINNKYAITPKGIIELKKLLSKGIKSSSKTNSSSDDYNIIKEFIANEDKNKPYSDEQIAILLKNRGIDIARRTITKYREILGIPSAGLRKIR